MPSLDMSGGVAVLNTAETTQLKAESWCWLSVCLFGGLRHASGSNLQLTHLSMEHLDHSEIKSFV